MWTYDDAGNILSRKEYAYTTGNLGTAQATVNYGYDNSNWGDLLTAYDGQAITHDGIGNPLTDGTWTYTWEHGRELMTMSGGGTTWTYTYDANGMRTKRTNGSTTYSYVYNGSSLSQMTVGSNTLNFSYDASGMPMAVTYGGATYYYVTNLQGDVVAILNSSGTSVVTYTYDAWGNILTTSGSMASTLGVHNPLRYRGYVYDTETELYYLQSRYYDPNVGRFINADAFTSTGQGLLGNNMFAYCGNNSVNRYDPHGAIPKVFPISLDPDPTWVDTPQGPLRYVTEHTKKGTLYEYWVDDSEAPRWSRHHTDHDNPKEHPDVPHDHKWDEDDDGNNKPGNPMPPNSGYQAPNTNDNSAKMVMGAVGTVALGYILYSGAKWLIAGLLAPTTGGGSLVVAGVTP